MKFLDIVLATLCLTIIMLCASIAYRWLMGWSSVAVILLFNVFFALILSQLDGNIPTKIVLLIIGNLLGIGLNNLFYFFCNDIHALTGLSIGTILTVAFPILNFIWIVPYWSFSLSLFSKRVGPMRAQT